MDERDGATVQYVADGHRTTVRDLMAYEPVGFGVRSITAQSAQVELQGRTEALQVVEVGQLAGEIEYELTDGRTALTARSDFGDGAAYPDTTWSCEPE